MLSFFLTPTLRLLYHRTRAKQVQYNDVKVLCGQEQVDFSLSLQNLSGTVKFNTQTDICTPNIFLSDSVPSTFLSVKSVSKNKSQ